MATLPEEQADGVDTWSELFLAEPEQRASVRGDAPRELPAGLSSLCPIRPWHVERRGLEACYGETVALSPDETSAAAFRGQGYLFQEPRWTGKIPSLIDSRELKAKVAFKAGDQSVDVGVQTQYLRTKANLALGDANQAFRETTFSVGRNITPSFGIDSHYRYLQGQVQVVGTQKINSRLSTTVSGATTVNRESDRVLQRPQEQVFLGGVSISY